MNTKESLQQWLEQRGWSVRLDLLNQKWQLLMVDEVAVDDLSCEDDAWLSAYWTPPCLTHPFSDPELGYFILDGHAPAPAKNILHHMLWVQNHPEQIIIAKTFAKDLKVSTVFLHIGIAPNLFETMVFGDKMSWARGRRYADWDSAIRGHEEIVALVQQCGDDETLVAALNKMMGSLLKELLDELLAMKGPEQ